MPSLSVVVPLFNEEENVGPLQEELAPILAPYDYELILVDDGSMDGTASRVKVSDRVRLLRLSPNQGQSAAMYAGIMAAEGDLIALMDGDLQNDPHDLPKLIEKINEGADLVCGYRANRKDTKWKRVQSKIANAVRSRFLNDGIRDTGCSLKVMRKDCRRGLIPFKGMHRFIPSLIGAMGFKIDEVPVNHRDRQHGASKYGGGIKRAIPATRDMFGVQWLNSRRIKIDWQEEKR